MRKKREADDSCINIVEEGVEHPLVDCRFLVERQRVGTGGGGHAPKADGSVGKVSFDILAYFRCRGVQYFG